MSKERVPGSHLSWWRLDCLAEVVGFELRNVVANYPFERSRRFPGIRTNSGLGDRSRLSPHTGQLTAWLGWEDSNSEMLSQNIPLKGRTDFRAALAKWSHRPFRRRVGL